MGKVHEVSDWEVVLDALQHNDCRPCFMAKCSLSTLRQQAQEWDAEIAQLRAELAAANERAERAEDLNKQSICVYCGYIETLESRGDLCEVMARHIAGCVKHPLNQLATLLSERDTAQAGWQEAVEALRSDEKWMREIRSLMFRTAKARILGLPCVCQTPEAHDSTCVRLRFATQAITNAATHAGNLVARFDAQGGKNAEV